MAAVLTAAQEDRLWSQLIGFIRVGALVPVIGPELLQICTSEGASKNFYTLVAEELAPRLDVEPPRSAGFQALNEVASATTSCGWKCASISSDWKRRLGSRVLPLNVQRPSRRPAQRTQMSTFNLKRSQCQ
jgi:hypothetical protein